MLRPKKQQCHLVRGHHLRKCEQRVKELAASTVKVINLTTAFSIVKEKLVGVQDNHDADTKITEELSDFENESELEYTDEESTELYRAFLVFM
jgi:hypothetical protein